MDLRRDQRLLAGIRFEDRLGSVKIYATPSNRPGAIYARRNGTRRLKRSIGGTCGEVGGKRHKGKCRLAVEFYGFVSPKAAFEGWTGASL